MSEEKKYDVEIGGRLLEVSVGSFAPQANASCTVKYGETVVLVTAVMSEKVREGINYFPLIVEYEERLYAAGRIKSSRFMKREGRPTEESILNARLVDRALRPRFDSRMRNDVQIVATVLSFDDQNDPDILTLIGASICLSISDIPWNGPLAAVHVGKSKNQIVVNPLRSPDNNDENNLVVAGDRKVVNMIELQAKELPEAELVEMLKLGQKEIIRLIEFQEKIIGEIKPQKRTPTLKEELSEAHAAIIKDYLKDKLEEVVCHNEKQARKEALRDLEESLLGHLRAKLGEEEAGSIHSLVIDFVDREIDRFVHELALKHNKRVDGRAMNEIRPIKVDCGILPRTHGSGYFRRGLTEALSILTLAGPEQEQLFEEMEMVGTKRFMHHYNFPPFSVGEVGPFRGPGRREIGHGALAERALQPLISGATLEAFPYTIRIVTEILSSNGSSSMASVCGASLALFDAGVPVKTHVAGIAIGLMSDDKNYKILTDIQGPEDHHGDMDLKVAGTRKGITAIQMDVKLEGVTVDLLAEALDEARTAREKILDIMEKFMPRPREKVSKYAPKVLHIRIPVEKIRDVIGSGGRVIHKIIDETSANIDIKDNGDVFISSVHEKAAEKALAIVKELTLEPAVGEVYTGKVSRIMDFGAFVNINPYIEGMIHISKLAPGHVDRVEDVLRIGEEVKVEVIEIDSMGRINLKLIEGGRPVKPSSAHMNNRHVGQQSRGRRSTGQHTRRGGFQHGRGNSPKNGRFRGR